METLEQRVQRVVREEVAIAPYDPAWPESFRLEKELLLSCLRHDLIRRVEHFGSTAVPGLAAKPIVDVLVEVTDLEATKVLIAPVLEAQGYDGLGRRNLIHLIALTLPSPVGRGRSRAPITGLPEKVAGSSLRLGRARGRRRRILFCLMDLHGSNVRRRRCDA
jgi:GrpB-like predicted nucleotidyltransferase (UPF0157 family)